MRRAAALAAAGALAVGAAGCGGGGGGATGRTGGGAARGALAWVGHPHVLRARRLPTDRVVIARVRNVGRSTLEITAADLVVRDAAGRRLRSSAAFTTTFAHGLFGALQQPGRLPRAELLRLGKIAVIPPGAAVPFYAAWRLTARTREPVRVDYRRGALVLPAPEGATAP